MHENCILLIEDENNFQFTHDSCSVILPHSTVKVHNREKRYCITISLRPIHTTIVFNFLTQMPSSPPLYINSFLS